MSGPNKFLRRKSLEAVLPPGLRVKAPEEALARVKRFHEKTQIFQWQNRVKNRLIREETNNFVCFGIGHLKRSQNNVFRDISLESET